MVSSLNKITQLNNNNNKRIMFLNKILSKKSLKITLYKRSKSNSRSIKSKQKSSSLDQKIMQV